MLSKTYKALVNYGPRDFRLEQLAVPAIGSREILLEIGGCGICAADVRSFYADPYLIEPVVPGHEFYGRIAAIGEFKQEESGLKAGDYITAEQIIPCGKCRYCISGKYWMCEVHHIHGFIREKAEGGMAEYLKLGPRSLIHKLPATENDTKWAMVEPLACAIHAVERADIQLEDTVVLAGLGPIGMCMLQIIKLKRPHRLIVIDAIGSRLEMGKDFGVDLAINPLKEDAVKIVKELTGGYGCDKYIECSGNAKAVNQGLEMLRRLGTFVEFSVFKDPATINWTIIGDHKELNIFGAHLSPYTYPTAIDFIARGIVDVKSIITHTYKLDDYLTAFDTANKKEGCMKVVLVP